MRPPPCRLRPERCHRHGFRVKRRRQGTGRQTGQPVCRPFAFRARVRGYIYVYVNVSPAMPDAARPAARTFTITELAQEFDVTPRAIRFYEDMGLLEPGRAGRNRVYTQRDRTRLKLTLRGKRLALSLGEIKQLVDMYDSPSDTAPQLKAFLAVLAEHRRQLEQQREDLEVTLAEIEQHEARCRALLAAARPRKNAKETLA
jgi:DNA-binding transcriptional MerR regulator